MEESKGYGISQVTEHASTKSDWVMSQRYAGLYCGIKIFASFSPPLPRALVLQLSREMKGRENVEKVEHNERAKHRKRLGMRLLRYRLTLWLQNISYFIAKFQPK